MHFLLIGATGRTGQLVVADALKRGDTVTALVRNPDAVLSQPGLTLVKGSPLDASDLDSAFSSSIPIDAVIVTLATSLASGNPYSKLVSPRFFMRDAVSNTIAAMKKYRARRLVVMSAFGAGNSFPQLPLVFRYLFRHSNMSYQFEDHDAVDALVREQGERLDWVLVRPPLLKEGETKAVREVGEEGKGLGLFDGVVRASVAGFLVDEARMMTVERRAVVIIN